MSTPTLMKMMATYGLAKEGIGKVKGGIDKVKKITGTGSATERMDNKIAKEAAKQAKIVAKDAVKMVSFIRRCLIRCPLCLRK